MFASLYSKNQSITILKIAVLTFSYPFVFPRRAMFCPAQRYLSNFNVRIVCIKTINIPKQPKKFKKRKFFPHLLHGIRRAHICNCEHLIQLRNSVLRSIAIYFSKKFDFYFEISCKHLQSKAFWQLDCIL